MPADGTQNLLPHCFAKGDPRINREGRPKGSISLKQKFKKFLAFKVKDIKGMPKMYNGVDISEWDLADFIAAQQVFINIDKSTKKELKLKGAQFLTEVTDGIKHVHEMEQTPAANEMQEKINNLPLEKLLEVEKIIESAQPKTEEEKKEDEAKEKEKIQTILSATANEYNDPYDAP